MLKRNLLSLLLLLGMCNLVFAQADDKRLEEVKKAAAKEAVEGWIKGGGVGLDFAQLALANPQVGAGQNRIGLGGLATYFFNYKRGKSAWDNLISAQLGIQKLGRGDGRAFDKIIDIARFDSKYGIKTKNDKIYMAILGSFRTQITPSYENNHLAPLTKPDGTKEKLLARMFAPGILELAPGIDYKVNDKLSIFFSPLNGKVIFLASDIYNPQNFGMELKDPNNANSGYKRARWFLGAGANIQYNDKYWNEKIVHTSRLKLFSNYIKEPQNIDIDWQNDFGLMIFKNISLNLLTNLFYDHDILVQKDYKTGLGYARTGRGLSFTESLLIKYNYLF